MRVGVHYSTVEPATVSNSIHIPYNTKFWRDKILAILLEGEFSG